MKIYTLQFDEIQHDFLRQLLENPQLNVPVKNAKVAGEVHALVTEAKPDGDPPRPRAES